MPAYVSHSIMAREVYNKINNDNVSLEYMLTFSQGGDLCKYSKCRRDSHNIKQDEFIYNMADYIISNNLIHDKECIGVLYGHICHYVMDDVIHPLIRKVDRTCKKRKNNHTLIEGYYDSYLSRTHCKKQINEYDNKAIFKGKMNRKITKMINYVYDITYNTKHVSSYYKLNIFLYKKIKYLYKLFSLKTLKKYSGFNDFMEDNKNVDLFNNDNKIRYNDYRKKESCESLDESYERSIKRAIEYINKINNYMEEKCIKK